MFGDDVLFAVAVVVAKAPYSRWRPPGNLFQVRMRPNTTMNLLYPIIPSGINPSIGIGPTQGQRKTLTRVGFEPTTFGLDHRC